MFVKFTTTIGVVGPAAVLLLAGMPRLYEQVIVPLARAGTAQDLHYPVWGRLAAAELQRVAKMLDLDASVTCDATTNPPEFALTRRFGVNVTIRLRRPEFSAGRFVLRRVDTEEEDVVEVECR